MRDARCAHAVHQDAAVAALFIATVLALGAEPRIQGLGGDVQIRLRPDAQIEKLAEFSAFKDASVHAKAQRTAPAAGGGAKIKLMFADNEQLAQDLLCQVREPRPTGED